jgi:drug/metabolite transporter (DMT)-like permease
LRPSPQAVAVFQAIFVTMLWASSWVLIKLGLRASLPALTFAGLRYVLAFVCLMPFVLLNPAHRSALRSLTRKDWGMLALLGIVYYTLTQGSPGQWFGIILTVIGVALYFLPVDANRFQIIGLLVAFGGVVTNAASALLGRQVNRRATLSPLLITFISMGFGSILLLVLGITIQGLGNIDLQSWLLIAWLAIVNTAFAFTLWNHTLRTLSAVESSVINSLMMPQIAILAFVFLGERLSSKEITGLVLVGLGVMIVQLRKRSPLPQVVPSTETNAS